MLPFRAILHPTDFSPSSDYAQHLAWSLARDHGARLIVLHVAAPPAVMYGEIIAPLAGGGYKDNAWKALRRLHWPEGSVPVELRVETGEPAKEILRIAQETPCDLIVIGTHGRTGMGRLLMGSVAEQVVRKAACPVVTVKSLAANEESSSQQETQEEGDNVAFLDP